MTYHSITSIILCWIGIMPLVLGQEATIRLIDQNTQFPIDGVYYRYGPTQGYTNLQGEMHLQFFPDSILSLSHINYGQWQLGAEAVQQAISSGIITRATQGVALFPVSVVAVHPKRNQALTLDVADKMMHDGGQILSRSAGIQGIRKSGNYGFDPVFRGFKYEQLNIVMDGAQSALAACPNRMDPPTSQMAPNMVDRIEILKGPYSLRYGAGLGATIHFVSRPMSFTSQREVHGRISGSYESNGDIFRTEGMLGISEENYELTAFGAWSQGADYQDGDGVRIPAHFKRSSYGANLGWSPVNHHQLRVQAFRNQAKNVDFPALAMDLRTDDTWLVSVRHDVTISGRYLQSWNTTLHGSWVDHKMDNLLKPLDPRPMNAATIAQTQVWGGRTEGYWSWLQSRLYSGFDFRVEAAAGDRKRDFLLGPMAGKTVLDPAWQDSRIARGSWFGEWRPSLGEIAAVISSRIEWNQATAAQMAPTFAELYPNSGTVSQWNPSFSAGLTRDMGRSWRLGLWLGRTQRSASLTERFIHFLPVGQDPFEMVGNPNLQPEVNRQADLNLRLEKSAATFEIQVFASSVNNYISSLIRSDLAPTVPASPGVRQFVNLDKAWKHGFEVNWRQVLSRRIQHNLSMAYTYGIDLDTKNPLPEIPPLDLTYQLSGQFVQGRLRPLLSFRQVLRQHRIAKEFGETATPAFSLIDLRVKYDLLPALQIGFGIDNVLDQAYYEHLTRSVRGTTRPIYAPGRNLNVSLSTRW